MKSLYPTTKAPTTNRASYGYGRSYSNDTSILSNRDSLRSSSSCSEIVRYLSLKF